MTRLNSQASTFIPGAGSHCPVNATQYRQCALETLNTPGGVPSHTFHIKFRADHGFPWKPEWAEIDKLNDLRPSGVGRWTESGQLIYGTEDVVLRRIYSSQAPPAPICMMTDEGLTIIPVLQYCFEEYDVAEETKTAFGNVAINGLTVRIQQKGKETVKVKLASHPWLVKNVEPWSQYTVAVQFVTKNFGTSLFSRPTQPPPTDLNVVFKYRGQENELKWAKHYKEYSSQVDIKKIENLLREYTKSRNSLDYFIKQVKTHEKIKEGGYRPRDARVVRISGNIKHTLDNEDPIITQSYEAKDSNSVSAKNPDDIHALQLRISDANGNMKIIILTGFNKEIEIKHVSGKFRKKKKNTN